MNNEKKIIKKRVIAIGLAVLSATALVAGCSRQKEEIPIINLNNYLTIEVTGLNGYAEAQILFDNQQFFEDNKDVISYKGKDESVMFIYENDTDAFKQSCVKYSENITRADSGNTAGIDSGKLENGDVISVSWEVDEGRALEYFGVNVECEPIEYTVSELEIPGTFDAFEGLVCEVTGEAGNADVNIVTANGIKEGYNWDNHSTNLNNGDVITFTLRESNPDIYVENYGAVPETYEYQYTVEGLTSYMTTLKDVKADTVDNLADRYLDSVRMNVENELKGCDRVSLASLKYETAYFKYVDAVSTQNYLMLTYKAVIHVGDTDDLVYYPTLDIINARHIDGDICEPKSDEIYFGVEREGTSYNRPSVVTGENSYILSGFAEKTDIEEHLAGFVTYSRQPVEELTW